MRLQQDMRLNPLSVIGVILLMLVLSVDWDAVFSHASTSPQHPAIHHAK